MRLSTLIKFNGSGTDDFQDIDLWRKSVAQGTKIFRAASRRRLVIVPMAFSRRDYFDEIVSRMREFDNEIKIYCLKAELPTILKRLEQRGDRTEGGEKNWIVRKAQECIEAHRDASFGEAVNTEGVTAAEVAADILERERFTILGV
jgi:chloramphenicol 3-O-phosphotransferase